MNTLTKQIEGTFHLLILWLNQHADTFINGNSLERALLICKSDQMVRISIFIPFKFQTSFILYSAIINKY